MGHIGRTSDEIQAAISTDVEDVIKYIVTEDTNLTSVEGVVYIFSRYAILGMQNGESKQHPILSQVERCIVLH